MAKGLAISYWPESPLALAWMSPVQASGLNVAGLNVTDLNVTHPNVLDVHFVHPLINLGLYSSATAQSLSFYLVELLISFSNFSVWVYCCEPSVGQPGPKGQLEHIWCIGKNPAVSLYLLLTRKPTKNLFRSSPSQWKWIPTVSLAVFEETLRHQTIVVWM
jgi:hypothetical protein